MKLYPIVFLGLAMITSVKAEVDKSYFNKLDQERVESTTKLDWKQFGPGMAGYCEEFWCHPTDVNTMLMGPDMHVTFGSWDRGKSWHTVKDCDGTGYDMERVIEVAFSHQDPDFGLAIDRDGNVCDTHDRGRTWSVIEDLGKCHSELAVDPTNDKYWYIGAGDFFNLKEVHRSAKEPQGNINKRSDYGWIWRSTNRGKSWTKVTDGLPEMVDVGRIVVDPTNPKIVLAATGHGLYRSENRGVSWKKSGADLPNNLPRDLTSYYDKKSGKYILYLVEHTIYKDDGNGSTKPSGGVFKSVDGGKSWSSINGNLAIDLTAVKDPDAVSCYYRTLAKWYGVTTKEARSRFPKLPKSTYSTFNRIRVNPNNPDEIYLVHNYRQDFGFPPGDCWSTKDGGKTWIASLRVGKYWMGENPAAEYWAGRNNPTDMNIKFSHIAPFVNSRNASAAGTRFFEINVDGDLYTCVNQQTLRSTDKGKSWQQVDDNETETGSNAWVGRGGSDMPGRYMLLETGIKGRMFFCSGEHGLWENAPLGNYPDKDAVAVKQIDGQLFDDLSKRSPKESGAHSIATVAVDPNDPNKIYSLVFRQEHRDYLRRSIDGGKTWENYSKPIANFNPPNTWGYHMFQFSLMIDPEDGNNFYFNSIRDAIQEVGDGGHLKDYDEYGVHVSRDGGRTWSLNNNGLPDGCSVRRLCMDPRKSSTLYAAVNTNKAFKGGLFVSKDRAESWREVAIPENIRGVNNVFVDRNSGYIYISCGTRGGVRDGGGVYVSRDGGKRWSKIFDMPFVWQSETSPVDSNIITVNSAGCKAWGKRRGVTNPGAYISFDGGESWTKANRGLGQPDKITDFKPDPYDKNVFWCALWGSGWYKGVWSK